MGLNILQVNNRTIIPYEVIPFAAGIYVGYNKAKGIDIGTLGDIATYAPTALPAILTPVLMIATKSSVDTRLHHFAPEQGEEIESVYSAGGIAVETGINTVKSLIAELLGFGFGYIMGNSS